MATLGSCAENLLGLSKYGPSLDAAMKERCMEKVEKIGFDPYDLKPSMVKKVQENPSLLPFIECPSLRVDALFRPVGMKCHITAKAMHCRLKLRKV